MERWVGDTSHHFTKAARFCLVQLLIKMEQKKGTSRAKYRLRSPFSMRCTTDSGTVRPDIWFFGLVMPERPVRPANGQPLYRLTVSVNQIAAGRGQDAFIVDYRKAVSQCDTLSKVSFAFAVVAQAQGELGEDSIRPTEPGYLAVQPSLDRPLRIDYIVFLVHLPGLLEDGNAG